MGKIIPKQVLEQIRSANDIADVLGGYLQLKKSGTGFMALCPFHKEKSPSFHINQQRQIFHCFGCGAGGDVFKFIMQQEGVDFTTAAKMLAQKAGIRLELEESDGASGESKEVLFRIHEEAAKFYHRILLDHPSAADARAYLKKRDLGPEVIESFQLGFAPNRADAMTQWANANNFTIGQVEAAGLIARSAERGDLYDRFRSRLMFPVRDELGRVIAFSGRILENDDRGAKYLNSPETPLFRKSRVLYAMDKARKAILESRTATLCEGQIDVIRCHIAGLNTTVAGLGTAITEEHARLIKRYADSVVLVMDADTAGQNSAIRSAEIFLAAGLTVRVVSLPEGEDPDSLIRKGGAQPLLDRIAQARGVVEFQVDVLTGREDAGDEAGRLRIAKAVLETIGKAPTAVQRDQMTAVAAKALGFSESALRSDLSNVMRKTQARSDAASKPVEKPPVRVSHPHEEVEILRVLIHHPEQLTMARAYLSPDHFASPPCRQLIEHLLHEGADDLVSAIPAEDDECQRLTAEILAGPSKVGASERPVAHALQDLILGIRRRDLERRRKLHEEKRAAATGDAYGQLDAELKQMVLDLRTLREGWDKAQWIIGL